MNLNGKMTGGMVTVLVAAMLTVSAMASAQKKSSVLNEHKMATICEDTCSHIHGIDISHHQRDIDWETIGKNTAISFVYLKCTEGEDHVDSLYLKYLRQANEHGMKVGSYHFYRPKADQHLQVENLKSMCRPGDQDLIPMIDVETKKGVSDEELCDSLLKFLRLVEEAYKQKPLIYTYRNFYNKHLLGKLDGYKLMIAQYTDEEPLLNDGRDYLMWQYTCKGRLEGASGFVDKSRFMGNHALREIRFIHR